jgi:hypothetical protein
MPTRDTNFELQVSEDKNVFFSFRLCSLILAGIYKLFGNWKETL